MAALSLQQVAAFAVAGGLTSPEAVATACAIAGWSGSANSGESGGDPGAIGDQTLADNKWGNSYGLWQIRSLRAEAGTGGTRDETKLLDPTFNARSMFEISGGGSNWQPWSVYTSGKYRANMDAAAAHVEQLDGGGDGWRDRIVQAAGWSFGPAGALIGPGADLVGGAAGVVTGGVDALGQLGSIASTVTGLIGDPSFWRRVGLFLGGLVLIVGAASLLGRDLLGGRVESIAKRAAAS